MTLEELDRLSLSALDMVVEDWHRHEARLNAHLATVRSYSELSADPELDGFQLQRGLYRSIMLSALAAGDAENRRLLAKLTWLCGPTNLP